MDTGEPSNKDLITIGKVLKEWALKGEILVLPLTFDPKRFFDLQKVAIHFETPHKSSKTSSRVKNSPGNEKHDPEWKRLKSVKSHNDLILLGLENCDTPEEARKYRGALIKISHTESPELPEGLYYHYQITGLSVYTVDGDLLGEIVEIMETSSNDIYVVRGNSREYLVPAIKDVIKDIDLKSGKMTVKLMEPV